MSTQASIASQALLLLRHEGISALSESPIVEALYDDHIKHILSIYPWTFATKKRLLVQDSTAPINEYTYSHIIPAETLLIWALFNSDDIGASPVRDYDIYGTETARRIFSNHETLYADYTIYADENVWPPYFTLFAIHSLAAHVAIATTGNDELAMMYEQKAYGSNSANRKGGLFGVAAATDAKQKRNEIIVSSPIVEARFS